MIEYEYVTRAERLGHIANEINDAGAIGLDVETTGFSPIDCKIRLVQINTGKGIYVVDAFQCGTLDPIVPAIRDSKCVTIIQNGKFEQKFFLYLHDLEIPKIFDTYRASALIHNGRLMGKGVHDLYALYARELNITAEAPDKGASDWSQPALDQSQLDYAAEDVFHLHKLRGKLKPQLAKNGLNDVALAEFQAILPEAAMELNGFGFDKKAWLALAEENEKVAKRLRQELLHELPHPHNQMALPGFDPDFNIDSPSQLLASLNRLGLGIQDTNEMTLAMFAAEFKIIKKVLDYREYAQAVKTFGREFVQHVNPKTGRIHTSFFPFTGAGRYSSTNPNLQNVPRKKEFRQCFVPPEGYSLVGSDYSQIELRVTGEVSEDEMLIDAYCNGKDVHAETASLVMGVDPDKVTKADRQKAKAINFGFIYGMGAFKLVRYAQANYNAVFTIKEAEAFRKKYFTAFSGVEAWHRRQFSDENKKRALERTLLGRIRYLRADMHSEFANTKVQGTAADGLKKSLPIVYRKLKKYGKDARMVHMVHDEILTEARKDPELIAAVKKDLQEGMIEGMQPMLHRLPVEAEAEEMASWADK